MFRLKSRPKSTHFVIRTSPFTTESAYRALEAEGLVRIETAEDGAVRVITTDKGRQVAEEVQAAEQTGKRSVAALKPVVQRLLSETD
jgi:DNA-binding transcriptional regulator YhcF (GntR family)